MKTSIFLAAAALAASSEAGVHKMKLKKIPLSDQLVSHHRAAVAIGAVCDSPRSNSL